jgi:hypothetical protein
MLTAYYDGHLANGNSPIKSPPLHHYDEQEFLMGA